MLCNAVFMCICLASSQQRVMHWPMIIALMIPALIRAAPTSQWLEWLNMCRHVSDEGREKVLFLKVKPSVTVYLWHRLDNLLLLSSLGCLVLKMTTDSCLINISLYHIKNDLTAFVTEDFKYAKAGKVEHKMEPTGEVLQLHIMYKSPTSSWSSWTTLFPMPSHSHETTTGAVPASWFQITAAHVAPRW